MYNKKHPNVNNISSALMDKIQSSGHAPASSHGRMALSLAPSSQPQLPPEHKHLTRERVLTTDQERGWDESPENRFIEGKTLCQGPGAGGYRCLTVASFLNDLYEPSCICCDQ